MKQLELDFGMLTVEQQQRVDRFIVSEAVNAEKAEARIKSEMQLFSGAGFRPGIDFVNDFTNELVTEDYEFGYGDSAFIANVTYQKRKGGIHILAKQVKLDENDQIIRSERRIYFTTQNDYKGTKIECSTLVGSYRAVKPETLFTKLMEYNQQQEDNVINEFERRIAKRSVITKLKAEYPQATIVREEEQYVNRGYRKMISVHFADGSRFDFERTWNNDYRLYQVIDGQKLGIEQLAELIANRNK